MTMYRLGKAPPKHDARTLRMASLLLPSLPPIPDEYDFDAAHPGCDVPMFLNDELGCCVIAGRAHLTRRMELIEQGIVIDIKDDEVSAEYFKESGGRDSGLVMLDSLNEWRQRGWRVGRLTSLTSLRTYTIHAYAAINPKQRADIEASIYLLNGAYAGVALPVAAKDQIGEIWTVTTGLNAEPGSWGGHAMAIVGYNTTGPVFLTWGKRQQATWDWFMTYTDECYAIVDSTDKWIETPGIDTRKLEQYLTAITA